jgi:hypothetical protein
MARPRAADDFPVIRARLQELRREREQVETGQMAEPYRRPLSNEHSEINQKELRPIRVPGRFFSRAE